MKLNNEQRNELLDVLDTHLQDSGVSPSRVLAGVMDYLDTLDTISQDDDLLDDLGELAEDEYTSIFNWDNCEHEMSREEYLRTMGLCAECIDALQ